MSNTSEDLVREIIEILGTDRKSKDYNDQVAAFTHYLHNSQNGVSKKYKYDAISCVVNAVNERIPGLTITRKQAEPILTDIVNSHSSKIPFPAKKTADITFIDLFAGIGGFRRAMQNLGGKCVFTSEWDKNAKKSYRANYGEIPFGDITDPRVKNYIPDNFDVLCAGFPCQAFSIAGERGGFEDTRGTLFFDVAEIIKKKKPKAFFLENVKGLVSHRSGDKKTLDIILKVLREDLNYYVPEPKIVNAKDFGLAQNRERIFIVGFKKSLGVKDFEIPTRSSKKKAVLKDIRESTPVDTKYFLSQQYYDTLVKHRDRHKSKGNGFGFQVIKDDRIANAVVVGGMGRERNLIKENRKLTSKEQSERKTIANKESIRVMTPLEWAKLQGFSEKNSKADKDKFLNAVRNAGIADAQIYKQLGNSVAIPAIQATASLIIKELKNAR